MDTILLNHRLNSQNQDLSGRDALTWTAAVGHLEVIKLLSKNVKPNAPGKDKDQRNVILWAAGGGHYEVVDYLIKCNSIETDAEDFGGWTSLA
ncbi:hypothetical protein ACHAPF_011314 [Botrytis cinerea]